MFDFNQIEIIIESALRAKLKAHSLEPSYKPFHNSLMGKDRMALFSFIHSLNTTMGTSIYEKVAQEIAKNFFEAVTLQQELKQTLREFAQDEITKIMNETSHANKLPNQREEIERIREQCYSGKTVSKKLTKVDLYLRNQNFHYPIDIKTAKPNFAGFKSSKQTMLEWASSILNDDPDASVRPITAIPSNPYHPKPYSRWTMTNVLDDSECGNVLIAEKFWDFLAGGTNIYTDLLSCFENVGNRMRKEFDDFFSPLAIR